MGVGELAQVSLARVARDFDRNRAILRSGSGECAAGAELATGPWGVAIALAEMARRTGSISTAEIAQRMSDVPGPVTGRGLFVGREGQRCAQAAAQNCIEECSEDRGSSYLSKMPTPSTPVGDLIDGYLGQLWARQCLGGELEGPMSNVGHDALGANPGLAHGKLGWLACRASALTEAEFIDVLSEHPRMERVGWCNGVSGIAVAAAIGVAATGSSDIATIAKRHAQTALECIPLETDGLCHGSAGVLAVGAAVARCIGDEAFQDEVSHLAGKHWGACRKREWRLDPGLVADQSWLTGVAGVSWAQMAVDMRPLINPLCPADSVFGTARAIPRRSGVGMS